MAEDIERRIIEIIATDRIDKPISSMSGKLKRAKPKLAGSVALEIGKKFEGERTFARVEDNSVMKARGMKEGIERFEAQYSRYGKILRGYIEEEREIREIHLYFEMRKGCRLTSQDYMGVMRDLGFSESTSERLYPELMDISYKLAKKREEGERSILIG